MIGGGGAVKGEGGGREGGCDRMLGGGWLLAGGGRDTNGAGGGSDRGRVMIAEIKVVPVPPYDTAFNRMAFSPASVLVSRGMSLIVILMTGPKGVLACTQEGKEGMKLL